MAGRKISLLVLAVFIVGTFLLIYIQYNASKNISNLIDGNEMMLKEFTVNTTLLDMEKEIAAVENIVRETMITNDTSLVRGLPLHQQKIASGLAQLQAITKNDSSAVAINTLNGLVQRKLSFSTQVLDSFRADGREAARKLLSTGVSRRLSDSILQVTQKIDHIREQHLADIIQLMDRGGKKAQRLGMWLVILVLVSAAGFLWYIVTIIRKQMSLIRQLDAANQKQQLLIEELDASEKKVREAAKIKERFIAIMSHDIKAPLTAVFGYTGLLQKKKLDEESFHAIDIIEQAGNNMLNILNDYLELSSIEAGRMQIQWRAFKIRNLLGTIASIMKPKVEERNLQLLTNIDKRVPEKLIGDDRRLSQILLNLTTNALKFTQQGKIVVNVMCDKIIDDRAIINITVVDTGIGIKKEELPHIFEWFHQAGDTVSRNYGGTGLGLAIVKELVSLLQGTIAVESEPGKGTTFRLMIPFYLSDASIPPGEEPVGETVSPTELKNIHLLLVEDDPFNRRIFKEMLESWGVSFDVASSGEEAIDKLKVSNFDLVLMDISMPNMSGFQATQYIRNELHSDVLIFAMTFYGTGVREECIKSGMTDCVSKPVELRELNRIIKQYLPSRKRIIPEKRNTYRKSTASYTYINLEYMQEVGNGDKDYERSVTEQFLAAIPEELETLKKAHSENDITLIKEIAHNMRTTISVMGLNEKMQPFLDRLEYEDLSEEDLQSNLQAVKEIGEAALIEAKQFYDELIIAQ